MTGQSGSRLWLAGGAVVAVLIVLVSWFLVIGPVRADTQGLNDQTEEVETQNALLQTKIDGLKEVNKHRDELIAQVQKSLAALPPDLSLPDFNTQILTQAADRNVEVVGISVGAANSTTTAVPADPTTPATGQLAIPITIQVDGAMLDELYFVRDLQEVGPRLALVTSTAYNEKGGDEGAPVASGAFTLTIQLTIFTSSLTAGDREQLAEVLGDDLSG